MKNNELATQPQVSSPFDVIRHFDEEGNEYWQGRELMKLMGYTKWQRFQSAISEAMENLDYEGDSVDANFLPLMVKSAGRQSQDYKLSRYACYMTALCCDNRKPQVKSAKKYFAVKAREAEVIVPAQSEEIEKLKLQLEITRTQAEMVNTQKYLMDRSEAIAIMHGPEMLALISGRPDAVVTKTEVVNETVVVDASSGRSATFTGQSTAQLGKSLGFKSGKKLEEWLNKIGHGDLINQGLRAVQAPYIPEENIAEVKRLWQGLRGNTSRQLLLGE
ncbi:MAG: BRO family protein [Microcoleaceae cyanobacterium]